MGEANAAVSAGKSVARSSGSSRLIAVSSCCRGGGIGPHCGPGCAGLSNPIPVGYTPRHGRARLHRLRHDRAGRRRPRRGAGHHPGRAADLVPRAPAASGRTGGRPGRARDRQGRADLYPRPERCRLPGPLRRLRAPGHHRLPDQLAAHRRGSGAGAGARRARDDGDRRVGTRRGGRVAVEQGVGGALVSARRHGGRGLHAARGAVRARRPPRPPPTWRPTTCSPSSPRRRWT